MRTGEQSHRIARRAIITGVAGSALAAVLAACGATGPTPTPLPNRDSFAQTQVAISAGFADLYHGGDANSCDRARRSLRAPANGARRPLRVSAVR